jgi:hypothetical protein
MKVMIIINRFPGLILILHEEVDGLGHMTCSDGTNKPESLTVYPKILLIRQAV